MVADLARIAAERGIQYFLISYVDLFGCLRAKLARYRLPGGVKP